MKSSLKMSLVASIFCTLSQAVSALPVYINEFHYDNVGGDQNEFVEIAGVSGTNLDGWTLEFYNGGNGARYMTWLLDGVIDNEVNDLGALAFTGRGGIQNGGADGIALIDANGIAQQFLSYEGALTASSGTLAGQTSIDIGISETSSTALGMSLQLTGTGREDFDFQWSVGQATMGDINHFQDIAQNQNIGQQHSGAVPVAVSEPGSLASFALASLFLLRRQKRLS